MAESDVGTGGAMGRIVGRGFVALVVLFAAALAAFEVRHQQGNRDAARWIAEFEVHPVGEFGSTTTLRILPLIEYHTVDPALRTEVGVSYLIETDDHRILFDVGHNATWETPSPLQQNMEKLGVDLASIDIVFLSHRHMDHSGGQRWVSQGTFSLGTDQPPFPNPDVQVVVPAGVTYPGITPVIADRPMKLGNGVHTAGLGSTGTLPRQLVIGRIEEQSLVVNVEGLGGVLVVGCGHQPVPNLVVRYEEAFDEPLYGIVGGIHLPVPKGRIQLGPIDAQRRLASGDGLFRPLTLDDAEQVVAMLELRAPGLVAVGSHDSSDEVIALLGERFGERFRHVRVGDEILIRSPEGAGS
jgi:metal-dependent hydrolase (beta-lactamase superfamily II)